MLKNVSDKLKGIYLPYQLFGGTVGMSVKSSSKDNIKWHKFNSYVNQKLIVASSHLPNHLLENIEPYDTTNLQPFDFIYLAGSQAKTQDKFYDTVFTDFKDELKQDLLPNISKHLKTKYLEGEVDNVANINSVPTLMPIYYLQYQHVSLAINGQTGKLCLFAGKTKKTYPWLWKPFLFTFLFCLAFFFVMPPVAIASSPFVLLISMAITSQIYKPLLKFKYKIGKKEFVRDKNRTLIQAKNPYTKSDIKNPVVVEYYKGEKMPVDIKVFPLHRILSYIIQFLIVVFAPVILCVLLLPIFHPDALKTINEFNRIISQIFIYSGVWLSLMIPVNIVVLTKEIRMAFDKIYVRPINTRKRFRKAYNPQFAGIIRRFVKTILSMPILWIIGIIFIFIIPILATIFGMK